MTYPIALSIIVPVLNEAENLAKTLATMPTGERVEVIVVDGGSRDQTVEIAQTWGATVIRAAAGRAWQMNRGAALARGEMLLFVHGDTQLPPQVIRLIHQTLAQPGVVAGAFQLRIDTDGWGVRWIEWGVQWRSRFFQLPYGDQAIFLRTATFRAIGGFANLPIMEDVELIRQLKQQGRIAIAPATVVTSARRWRQLGILRTTWLNQLMLIGYWLKIDPNQLARWYGRH